MIKNTTAFTTISLMVSFNIAILVGFWNLALALAA